jgi:hypothetical protein
MPAEHEPVFVPDRRGNRLERHVFEVAADGRSHRLLLRASSEIARQFERMSGIGYRPTECAELASAGWTHCLEARGMPAPSTRDLADLLAEVITLPISRSIDFAIAMDWYKVAADDIDPREWRNTPDGQRVYVGKYWISSPDARAAAGRSLVRRLVSATQRHPSLTTSANVVVAVPGHDRAYLSFGERLAASVSNILGLPLVRVTTPYEFRPPAKDLPTDSDNRTWDGLSVTEDLSGCTALIIDDVFRTGRTMSAVGSAVMRAGAIRACGLVAVRTMRR